MTLNRRHMLAAGLGLSAAPARAASPHRTPAANATFSPTGGDTTSRLQRAIDAAAASGLPLEIGAGSYDITGPIRLASGTKLVGPHGLATFNLSGDGALIASNADNLLLAGLVISGTSNQRRAPGHALLALTACTNLDLRDLAIDQAPGHAIKLWQCSGRIERCRITRTGHTAINSGNAQGLDIAHNTIAHAGNNGIVAWRDRPAADGTTITNNHISHIRSDLGGSGQNGNAINAFRTGHVIIATNMIADCAYSAVRCNAASNAQIIANNCRNIGEVALYAEFGFEGAVIANNIVDHAATGIEVTNFKEGGRLATVQGNIIRNLVRREHEPDDKRGIGISVEADTVVNANTIENAATAGMWIGWGPWLRNVTASGNLIRGCAMGIAVSAKGRPATVLVTNNVISQTPEGAVRLLDHATLVGPPLTDTAQPHRSPAVLQGNLIS